MWGVLVSPGVPRVYYVGIARFKGDLACIEPQDLLGAATGHPREV